MSNIYRHRIYDSIFVTEDGKVGIGALSDGTETLNVDGDAKISHIVTTEVTSSAVTLIEDPMGT